MKLNLSPEEVDILLLGLTDLRFRCDCNAAMTNMSADSFIHSESPSINLFL